MRGTSGVADDLPRQDPQQVHRITTSTGCEFLADLTGCFFIDGRPEAGPAAAPRGAGIQDHQDIRHVPLLDERAEAVAIGYSNVSFHTLVCTMDSPAWPSFIDANGLTVRRHFRSSGAIGAYPAALRIWFTARTRPQSCRYTAA